MIISASGNKKR